MRDLPHGFDIYLVNVKTMRKIAQIFVSFSEKLNFKQPTQLIIAAHNCHIKYLPHRKDCTEYGKQLEAKI